MLKLYVCIGDMNFDNIRLHQKSFDRIETYNYYNFKENRGDAASFLVGNAICGTTNAYEFMKTDDITLHLLIARFVKTLSRIQRNEFALIMEMIDEKYRYDFGNNESDNIGNNHIHLAILT